MGNESESARIAGAMRYLDMLSEDLALNRVVIPWLIANDLIDEVAAHVENANDDDEDEP